ncbi:hypothetical protein [Halovivax limisalsi]|uniref:hypothetical protein n=1 Tax=Halovivax limisalsi TaxID=1453760 RepID=UPI001FFC6A5C|nr:hypothetical protein [Halovivax limisalsi]
MSGAAPGSEAAGQPSDRPEKRGDGNGRIDRRTVLESAASAGYALGLAGVLGIGRALDPASGTVEVETALVRRPDESAGDDPGRRAAVEPLVRTVPADWYRRVRTAMDVHRQLLRTRLPGYLNSAVVPGSYGSGTVRLSIGVRNLNDWSLPRTIGTLASRIGIEWDGSLDGISIELEEQGGDRDGTTPSLDSSGLVRTPYVDPVPGGVRCSIGDNFATLTPALYGTDGRARFATALHAFPEDDATGTELGLPSAENVVRRIGYVADPLPDADVAVVSPVGAARPGSVLGRDGTIPVVGQYTLWGLADLVARGKAVEMIGGTSGHTSGRVHGIDASTCVTTDRCRRGQLKWGRESDIADGDSGSVTIDPEPDGVFASGEGRRPSDNSSGRRPREDDGSSDGVDGALVASVNSARTWWPGQNHVWGVAAHTITERHGYHF